MLVLDHVGQLRGPGSVDPLRALFLYWYTFTFLLTGNRLDVSLGPLGIVEYPLAGAAVETN